MPGNGRAFPPCTKYLQLWLRSMFLFGSACLWKAGAAPAGCEACWREGGGSAPPADWPQRPVCLECFEKAHIYSNYLYHRVPGPRPACGPVGGGAS